MNIIEEYLVKIGATTDTQAFTAAENAINGLSNSLTKLTSLLKWGGIASLLLGIVKGIEEQIKSVARLDLQYQKLAKDMWVTKETAKQLTVIKDVMKASENDIAFIPELREQFMRLRAEMQAFATPPDADEQLKWVRSLGYEVQSLQVKLQMFREWLVYYLIKYLGPYIQQLKEFLQWLNEKFGTNMASWANKLAYMLSKVVSILWSAGRAVKYVADKVWEIFDSIPEKGKKIIGAFALIGAAIMAGPFGLLVAAIGGALLLLEDFFYFLDGKKSSRTMAPVWSALLKFANGPGGRMFDGIKQGLADIFDILGKMFTQLKIQEMLESVNAAVTDIGKGITELIKGIEHLFTLLGINKDTVKSFFGGFGDYVTDSVKSLAKLAGAMGKVFKAVGLALQGQWSEAASILWEGLKQGFGAVADGISQTGKFITGGYSSGGYSSGGYSSGGIGMKVSAGDNPDLEHLDGELKGTLPVIGGMLQALGVKDPEITSGYRSKEHNRAVGGAENSWHTHGKAVDIYVGDISDQEAARIKNEFTPFFGEVLYHDAGTGKHLHLADYKGGLNGADLAFGGAGAGGGATIPSADNSSDSGANPSVWERISNYFNPESYAGAGAPLALPGGGSVVNGNNNTSYNIGSIVIYSNDAKTAGESVINAIKQRAGDRGGTIR